MNVVDASNQRVVMMTTISGGDVPTKPSSSSSISNNNSATKEAQALLEQRLKEAIAERQDTEVRI